MTVKPVVHTGAEGDEMGLIERESGAQNYEAWFTEYPRTHRRAGQTVEVVTRAACERLRHDASQGAVARVEALERELGYAIDALEGKPWTGWSTDTARDTLQGGQS